jgi:hypothetical protein
MAAKEVQKKFRISGERGTKPVGYTAKQERPESMKETKIVNKTQLNRHKDITSSVNKESGDSKERMK